MAVLGFILINQLLLKRRVQPTGIEHLALSGRAGACSVHWSHSVYTFLFRRSSSGLYSSEEASFQVGQVGKQKDP